MTFGSGEMQSHGVSLKTDAKNPTHDPFIPISIIYRLMAKKVMTLEFSKVLQGMVIFAKNVLYRLMAKKVMALEFSKVLQGMVIFAKNVLRFIFMMKSWPWKSAKCFKEWSFS